MNFINPALLLGFGAVSIPIIIHLLNRRRFRVVRWAAMEFLLIFKTRYMIDEFMWHFFMDDVWNQFLFLLYIVLSF